MTDDRYKFNEIFVVRPDGSISPRVPVRIGGITMGPGVSFGGGVSLGGVNIANYAGRNISCHVENGVFVITGFYV